MIDEKELVKACINQERAAQRQLYDAFGAKLYAVALRYLKNKDDAKDIVQESFIKIFNHIEKFRFDCPLDAWITRICVNTALNKLRKNKQIMEDLSAIYITPEPLIQKNYGLDNLNLEDLLRIINALPDGCKMVFNLHAIEGFKHSEIAEKLEISEGTVKSQYSRAKKLLQELLNKETKTESYKNILPK